MNEPYLLLTPGPLTTSKTVRQAMLQDWCTWDQSYNQMTQKIRQSLLKIARVDPKDYTAVLLQGSGTFSVEATISTVIPRKEAKLLVATNGAYGKRIAEIAHYLEIPTVVVDFGEVAAVQLAKLQEAVANNPDITHFAMVHCETTTGILNTIETIIPFMHAKGIVTIVDAMSSFGGIEIPVKALQIDFLISSANKCIQGVPGFAFVIANRRLLRQCAGQARSLSLDLFAQNKTMDDHQGKWRFTSPTHVVHAFYQALQELEVEGHVLKRNERFSQNERLLVAGMARLGFMTIIDAAIQSPIITSFAYPTRSFDFEFFYQGLKAEGFVIYPGKVSQLDTFRIGNIGEVYRNDIERLLLAVAKVCGQLAARQTVEA